MVASRDQILGRLRAVQALFQEFTPPQTYLPVVPVDEADLAPRFITQAEKLGCQVHSCASEAAALHTLDALLAGCHSVLGWEVAHIPLAGLEAHLRQSGILISSECDESVKVGITGVDAALASTGSLVITSGEGKPRFASLLPPIHIAIVRADQIMPSFETWIAQKRISGDFREAANTVLISGPSRTADIALQLVMGMHGPEALHILLLNF